MQIRGDYGYSFSFQVILMRGQFWLLGIVIACFCVSIHLCVNRSQGCLHNNLWPVQVGITKFGPKAQNTLVKVPIVLGVIDLDPDSQILLQSHISPNSGLEVCQRDNSSPDNKIWTIGAK